MKEEFIAMTQPTLKNLRAIYARTCQDRVRSMANLLAQLEAQPADRGSLEVLYRHFHGLAGAGASFGFDQVTELGRRGEAGTRICLERQRPSQAEDRVQWARLIEAIRLATQPEPETAQPPWRSGEMPESSGEFALLDSPIGEFTLRSSPIA